MKTLKRAFSLIFALCIVVSQFSFSTLAASLATTPSGYTSASQVVYKTYTAEGRSVVANWGAREETATFLSKYAQNFYTGSDTFNSLSQNKGGTSQSNASSSALYNELKELMTSAHTFYTYYDGNKNVRSFYKYTDCVSNDTSKVSTIYLGNLVTSTWNGGNTWNQEHIWPQSKLSTSQQIGDIMHLRASNPSENSRRGNTPYGESSGYYTPAESVRGDCARMVLYMYVRWSLSSNMWGKNGVMENVSILLEWMEEDPVDTWELGRNDAVQSITGTRNVFVDYPEFAFLLFGEEIPKDMQTPSGMANQIGTDTGNQGNSGSSSNINTSSQPDNQGSSGNTNTSSQPDNQDGNYEQEDPDCPHSRTEIKNAVSATCSKTGYSGDVVCADCGYAVEQGRQINKSAHISADGNDLCDVCGAKMDCVHRDTYTQGKIDATCTQAGYTGDEICADCEAVVRYGLSVESAGEHNYGEWTIIKAAVGKESGLKSKTCTGCGDSVVETIPAPDASDSDGGLSTTAIVLIVVGALVLAAGVTVLVIVLVKKKKANQQ